jgi:hypothetical protein
MKQKRSQREDLPIFYKIILKVPKLSLDALSGNEKLHGIFWAAILPSLLFGDLFLNMLLIAVLIFPFNVLSVIAINSLIILLILRILVERALNSEKAYLSQGFNWNLEKSLEDYFLLIHKREDKETPNEG